MAEYDCIDYTQVGSCGQHALHYAIQGDTFDTALDILSHLDTLPDADQSGNNALHYLFSSTKFDEYGQMSRSLAKKLIEAGISTSKKNKDYNNPLHCAIKAGQIEALKLAIECNVDQTTEQPVFDFTEKS